jgi:hypothetical protein
MNTPTLSRRMFLGTVASVAASELVVQASPADIIQFAAPGHALQIAPTVPTSPRIPDGGEMGELVFNRRGQCIGVIEHIEVQRDPVDVTTAGDMSRVYMPGPISAVTYYVRAYGMAQARRR